MIVRWGLLRITALLVFSRVCHVIGTGENDLLEHLPKRVTKRNRTSSTNHTSSIVHESCLICNVAAADVQYGYTDTLAVDEFLACMTESFQEPDGTSNQVYTLDELPKAFVRRYKKQLYSGRSRICIHQGRTNRHTHQIVIPNSTAVELMPGTTSSGTVRRLYPTLGQTTVLVVRVTSTAGEDPGFNESQLEGMIFGTGPSRKNATLVSQYAGCSQGKLIMVPASGNNVVNGVLTVQYPGQIFGNNLTGALQSTLNQLVIKRMGVKDLSQAADHILFCLPTGSAMYNGKTGWLAFSYINYRASYFQRGWCKSLTAQVHEVGHQIGFGHSGVQTAQYGDKSCVMGISYYATARPMECFNGHKNWLSGWFDDRKVTINPLLSGPWVGNLVSVMDYSLIDKVQNGVAIIKAGFLYIQLNSAKKYNAGVFSMPNRVTVVENNATAMWSNLLVGLASGQSFTYANYNGSGFGLVIKVCNITFGVVDTAKVTLYIKDGIQTSQCPAPANPLPTPLPTRPPPLSGPPTTRPTARPTPKPTSRPSLKPTSRPTQKPTSSPPVLQLPTRSPTSPPQQVLTPSPSNSPTSLPTTTPTTAVPAPSSAPTLFPVSLPTPSPSSSSVLTSSPFPPPPYPPRSRRGKPRRRVVRPPTTALLLPTAAPTVTIPTVIPTDTPTGIPTVTPATVPTNG